MTVKKSKSTQKVSKAEVTKKVSKVDAYKRSEPVVAKPSPMTNDESVTSVSPKQKLKRIRDSFTIPKDEYIKLSDLKLRSTRLGHPMKKSEILRAGISTLSALSDTAFREALDAVPSLKTGRPKDTEKKTTKAATK